MRRDASMNSDTTMQATEAVAPDPAPAPTTEAAAPPEATATAGGDTPGVAGRAERVEAFLATAPANKPPGAGELGWRLQPQRFGHPVRVEIKPNPYGRAFLDLRFTADLSHLTTPLGVALRTDEL